MGSGQSQTEQDQDGDGDYRKESPSKVKPPAPFNLMITKEVSERWEAMAREKLEREGGKIEVEIMKPPIEDDGVSTDDIGTTGGGTMDQGLKPEPDMGKIQIEVEVMKPPPLNIEDEGRTTDESLTKIGTVGQEIKSELEPSVDKVKVTSEPTSEEVASSGVIEGRSKDEATPDKVAQSKKEAERLTIAVREVYDSLSDESVAVPEIMENVFSGRSGRDSPNLENHVEESKTKKTAVDVIQDTTETSSELISSETALQTSEGSGSYQLPEFEEMNEAFSVKKPTLDVAENDEDDTLLKSLESDESLMSNEIRIPKAILPVVIDENNTGQATVQTIHTWQIKERLEKAMVKNDEIWGEAMQNLIQKYRESTTIHADDVDRRIRELETKYPDIISLSSTSNGPSETPCLNLATDIGKCYDTNKTERLKCSDLIQKFAQCTKQSIEENFTYNSKL